MKLAKYLFIFLSLNYLFSAQVLSADCADVPGTTVTITVSCTDLNITGDSSNVTINSGVTIDVTGNTAVATKNSTNTTITIANNGRLSAGGNYGLRNSSPGHIAELINNGTITEFSNMSRARVPQTIISTSR
jgi:hypothetical protein